MTDLFRHSVVVRFQHCDPAGIVFFPRYFEMLNETVEAFFAAIGYDFAAMHVRDRRGVPTAAIAATFSAPSRLGDRLTFTLKATRIGRTSATLAFTADCDGERRLEATSTIVFVSLDSGRPLPWDRSVSASMGPYLDTADGGETVRTRTPAANEDGR